MSDPGGIELYLFWKPKEDLTRKPNLEVVAVPFVIDQEANALLARGGFIQLQVLNKYVNDEDLDYTDFGECTGYMTIYPGYVSKHMEIPTFNVRSYFIDWACVTIADKERSSFTVTMHSSGNILGHSDDYFWGRFG